MGHITPSCVSLRQKTRNISNQLGIDRLFEHVDTPDCIRQFRALDISRIPVRARLVSSSSNRMIPRPDWDRSLVFAAPLCDHDRNCGGSARPGWLLSNCVLFGPREIVIPAADRAASVNVLES
jgi:hypothetical protein